MTKEKLVFEFRSYKGFLTLITGGKQTRRGMKAKLAQAAGCQPTYISQVLHGQAHLSLEQAERLARHLKFTPEETQYFMLLVHRDRAGTEDLKKFYLNQMQQILERRLNVVNRLGEKNSLSEEQRGIFYSSWHYLAVLIGLTIPKLRTREALASYFQISLKRIDTILEFLYQTGLAKKEGNKIQVNTTEIRLGKDSPHIFRHHTHWRQQAIESFEREGISDLHYSAVVSLSKEDVLRLKDRMLENIKSDVEMIKISQEEEIYVYSVDFFSLKKII